MVDFRGQTQTKIDDLKGQITSLCIGFKETKWYIFKVMQNLKGSHEVEAKERILGMTAHQQSQNHQNHGKGHEDYQHDEG